MAKEKTVIDGRLQTVEIPFIENMDGLPPLRPHDKEVAETVAAFSRIFANANQFELHEIVNERWVFLDSEWHNLGNHLVMRRKLG